VLVLHVPAQNFASPSPSSPFLPTPSPGERKTSYLEDIAILTGGQLVKDELGITLDKADESVLGLAAKVVIGKESCTIVGDGRTQVTREQHCAAEGWGGQRHMGALCISALECSSSEAFRRMRRGRLCHGTGVVLVLYLHCPVFSCVLLLLLLLLLCVCVCVCRVMLTPV
jgi:hypothetical protein